MLDSIPITDCKGIVNPKHINMEDDKWILEWNEHRWQASVGMTEDKDPIVFGNHLSSCFTTAPVTGLK